MIDRVALFVSAVAVCGCAACPVVAPSPASVPKVDAGPAEVGPVTFMNARGEPFAELRGGELRIADGYTCADVAMAAVSTVQRIQGGMIK